MIIINNNNDTYPCLNERMNLNYKCRERSNQPTIVHCCFGVQVKGRHQDKPPQQKTKFILLRYGYSNMGSRYIFHCPSKNSSFSGKTFIPLATGFHLHEAILFSFLFEHFQSSPGSLPSPLNHLTSNCTTLPICEFSHSREIGGALRSSSSPRTSALSHPLASDLCSNSAIIICTVFSKR